MFLSWSLPPCPASVSPSGRPTASQQGERPHLSSQSEDPQRKVDGEGTGPAWHLRGEQDRRLPIQWPRWMPLLGGGGQWFIWHLKTMSPSSPPNPHLVLPMDFLLWLTQRSKKLPFLFPALHHPEPIINQDLSHPF